MLTLKAKLIALGVILLVIAALSFTIALQRWQLKAAKAELAIAEASAQTYLDANRRNVATALREQAAREKLAADHALELAARDRELGKLDNLIGELIRDQSPRSFVGSRLQLFVDRMRADQAAGDGAAADQPPAP